MESNKAILVINDLKKLGTKKRAEASKWYFKTNKGQYGFGDIFWGISVPDQRKIAKKYQDLSLPQISLLLKNKVHELRLTGLFILVLQFKKSDDAAKNKIVKFYLKHKNYINNWDLVDSSSLYILGEYLLDKNKDVLYKLAKSKNLWHRRIAIISTFAFIRKNQFKDTLKISKILLKDNHDLIHKAVGWALREVGKKDMGKEEEFLQKYAKVMPRTMLRYAIEKFPEPKRKKYLSL
jgi:3-methyladenine DNA glycosylase AlkD